MSAHDETERETKPFPRRLGELVVSIVVLTGVTAVFGYVGWVVLTLSARLGGPDPTTADGDPLIGTVVSQFRRDRRTDRGRAGKSVQETVSENDC